MQVFLDRVRKKVDCPNSESLLSGGFKLEAETSVGTFYGYCFILYHNGMDAVCCEL